MLWASVLVTTTSTAPAACAGVVAVIEVLLATFTPVAAVPPSFTVAPARKPVPVMVTVVPPARLPVAGEIPLTVGAGFDRPCPVARNVAICMTQPPEVIVALTL